MGFDFIVVHLLWATGIWGLKHMLKVLKKPILRQIEIKTTVNVPLRNHFVREGDPEQNISFRVDVRRGTPSTLRITNIDYEIMHDYRVIQNKKWTGLQEIKGDSTAIRIDLLYNPLESPLEIPPSDDKWAFRGTATIDCIYGRFTKSFDSTIGGQLTVAHDSAWEEIRNKVQRCRV